MRRNEGTMCTGTRSIIINIKRRSIDCFFARAGGGTVRQTRERNHHCNSSQASSFIINLKDAIDRRSIDCVRSHRSFFRSPSPHTTTGSLATPGPCPRSHSRKSQPERARAHSGVDRIASSIEHRSIHPSSRVEFDYSSARVRDARRT